MTTTNTTMSGQAAMVTGATSGLGRAVALGLAATEGRADGIRVRALYPGAMATNWGNFGPAAERGSSTPAHDEGESLDPGVVADLVTWMATSPGRPVLNEVTITRPLEQGWP